MGGIAMRSLSIISGLGLIGLLGCATPKYPPPPTYTLYAPPSVLVALPPEPKLIPEDDEDADDKDEKKEKDDAKPKKKEPPKVNPKLPAKPELEKAEPLPPPRRAEPSRPGGNIDTDGPIVPELQLPKLPQGRALPRIDLGGSGPLTLPPTDDPFWAAPSAEVEPLQLPPARDPR